MILDTHVHDISIIKSPDNNTPLDIKIKLMSLGYKFKPSIYVSNECCICMEKMNESMVLKPCGHCVCSGCLIQLHKNMEKISCPLCKKTTTNYEIIVTTDSN